MNCFSSKRISITGKVTKYTIFPSPWVFNFQWCVSQKWTRISWGKSRTSTNWWEFWPLAWCFCRNQNNNNESQTWLNMIQTFSVFRKYIIRHHWKSYDVMNVFQHLQPPRQFSSLWIPKKLYSSIICPKNWISNALPTLCIWSPLALFVVCLAKR